MAQNNEGGGSGARLALAVLSPIFIAAGFMVFPFLPAISAYLDGRTRTYTAAACTLLGCVALPFLLGPHAYGLSAFIVIATAAVYVLMRVKAPFSTGLVGAAGGGVLGAVALLGIVSAGYSEPLNVVIASGMCNGLTTYGSVGGVPLLSFVAGWFTFAQQQNQTAGLLQAFNVKFFTDLVAGKSTAEMLAIVRPSLEEICAVSMPALALVGGMLTGALGYYLPVHALDRRSHKGVLPQPQAMPKGGETAAAETVGAAADAPVPPFAAFKVPRYIVITLLLLQLVAMFLTTGDNTNVNALNTAAYLLFNVLMIAQALSMLSFFLNRRRIPAAAQFVLLALSLLFLWCILPYIGIFDALFDMRTVTTRMDMIRAKGKQVFTQEGLDELRRMEQRGKNGKDKNGKNGGEDGEN